MVDPSPLTTDPLSINPQPEDPLENPGNLTGVFRRLARAVGLWKKEAPLEVLREGDALRGWIEEAIRGQGKISGLVAVAKVADAYQAMDPKGRVDFFDLLLSQFSAHPAAINRAIAAYQSVGSETEASLIRLTEALESPRMGLFRQFNTIEGGSKFLVDLRADVLARLREHPSYLLLDFELRSLLRAWFNLGFLLLRRINWDTPASLLEKLVQYEAVHQIASWQDLKNRLISDRCCFAFVHPAMQGEPLIFLEVALVRGLAGSIQDILSTRHEPLAPEQADTAIFYSISNAQAGLQGIPFGNLLIKKVVAELRAQVPGIRNFATLSPIPRFRKAYLEPLLEREELLSLFTEPERLRLRQALNGVATEAGQGKLPALSASLREALATTDWAANDPLAEALRPGLLRALRAYLLQERVKERAACPVGHFHSANGAVLARINWLGDTSAKGLDQSCGMMVNYLYDMERFQQVQAAYEATGQLQTTPAVEAL